MLNLSFESLFKKVCSQLILEETEGVLLHLTHLEELILTSKQEGLGLATTFLSNLLDTFEGNSSSSVFVTVKYDGSPSLVCGYLPDTGKFFVATKSFGNKERKINTTDEEIIKNHGHAPGLVKKLQYGLKYLRQVIKPGTIFQGDFLFDEDDLATSNINGEDLITFTPNTITYAVEKNSSLGQRIERAKMGIIFHTKYEGDSLDNLTKSSNVNVTDFNITADVFLDDAKFKNLAGTATFTKQESKLMRKQIQECISLGNIIEWSSITDSTYEFLNTFVNSLVRENKFITDPVEDFNKFIEWVTNKAEKSINKMKTEKGRAAKQASLKEYLQKLNSNSMDIMKLFKLTVKLEQIKKQFVQKYNSLIKTRQFVADDQGNLQVTAPEGYVAVDKAGNMVKFVDRLEFSRLNFERSQNRKGPETSEEVKEKYVIILPGGYKPPTKGHMHMIESYNNNPEVSKVIVLIGPKEREGFTREKSLKVFKLYGIDTLSKVVIEDTKHDNPMVAGFDFIEKDPRAEDYKGLTFGFGASDKGTDAERADKLVKYFTKNPEKLRKGLSVEVPPIVNAMESEGVPVSATNLRKAIEAKDLNTISQLIPETVKAKDFLKIFNK
jgi:hypothetical protein